MKLIWQARAKTDPIDARKLAELLRVDLFPKIWLPDVATRERMSTWPATKARAVARSARVFLLPCSLTGAFRQSLGALSLPCVE